METFLILPDDSPAVRPSTASGLLMAYDILPDGNLKFKSNLIDFGTSAPDGMAVDKDENLYVAMYDRLDVFSPEGKKITEIKLPEVRNVSFGRGQFSKTLFIAAGKGIYMLKTKKEGYNLPFKTRQMKDGES